MHKNNLCRQFAKILDSDILSSEGDLCVVTRVRNIDAQIKGRCTRSPLVINALFSFEALDAKGNALNLGETVILQDEINPFISALRNQGIKVTALHNHWLFDKPRLFYIHFLSVENPLVFAKKVACAFDLLEKDCPKKPFFHDKTDFAEIDFFDKKDFEKLDFFDCEEDFVDPTFFDQDDDCDEIEFTKPPFFRGKRYC